LKKKAAGEELGGDMEGEAEEVVKAGRITETSANDTHRERNRIIEQSSTTKHQGGSLRRMTMVVKA
jgi:hypothetical protein